MTDGRGNGGRIRTLKAEATELYRQARLEDAGTLFEQVCRLAPGDAEAWLMLGAVYGRLGRFPESEACFRTVVALHSEHYAAWDNLGIALMYQGKTQQAEASYRRAIEVKPDYECAYNNLANLLRQAGRRREAVACCEQAIRIRPKYAEAHNNLGNILFDEGRYGEASEYYRHAISIQGNYADAYSNFGKALHRLRRHAEAATAYQRALTLAPNHSDACIGLGFLLWGQGNTAEAVGYFRRGLQLDPGALETIPRRAGAPVLKQDPSLQEWIRVAAAGGTASIEARLERGAGISTDPVFLRALERTVIADLELEQWLTSVREVLLRGATGSNRVLSGDSGVRTVFLQALASQCFNNEYVYAVGDDERRRVEALESELSKIIESVEPLSETAQRRLLVAAMYKPLGRIAGAQHLVDAGPAQAALLGPVIHQQIVVPLEEERLREGIESLTEIRNRISQAVGRQYDEAPYPRWLSIPRGVPRFYPQVFKSLFPELDPPRFPGSEVRILIAGCGTGLHAVSTAGQFENSRVLAVDISRNCLAYAKRKARELGVGNIDFKYADLLELGGIERRFDIIEAVGVLQTMEDPPAALRLLTGLLDRSGLIKIGLYSEIARRHITEASRYFKKLGYTDSDDDIRRVRRAILELGGEHPFHRAATGLGDFYTLSECRNLFFLVHEVRHSIPDITRLLESVDLEFIGFEFPDERARRVFYEINGEGTPLSDLDAWEGVERQRPEIFINMYNFWCRRTSR